MDDDGVPTSELRFDHEASSKVLAALAEVLDPTRFSLSNNIGMCQEGVAVRPLGYGAAENAVSECYWYFDNTFTGDEGYTDHFRVFYTTANGDCIDDNDPDGAPRVDADPITIAKWIAEVVRQGPPTDRHDD